MERTAANCRLYATLECGKVVRLGSVRRGRDGSVKGYCFMESGSSKWLKIKSAWTDGRDWTWAA